ncbi:MAG: SDR family oxidoreductase [Polyangiales bacterium]
MKIHGRSVLITGAGRGLGAAMARRFAREGAKLVLVARGAAVEALAEALRAEGATAYAIRADIAEQEAIYPLAHQATALVGPISVVVHNAGTLGVSALKPLQDTACEELARAMAVHVLGSFRLSKALLPAMVLDGAGVLAHVSTDAAVSAYPEWGAYGVSKAAMDHLSRSFAAELEGTGVRAFAVDPGEMDTALHAQALPQANVEELTRPEVIAARVLALIEREELAPNGSRVIAAEVAL